MSKEPSPPVEEKAPVDEPPPIFGSWEQFYLVVIANTILVYGLLWIFARCAPAL